ncbi:MAG: hypothetical protein LBL19_00205 [Spirochaetaceae bacterium]|jgi:hypothetical protein|nr:hypothetical protein [Spirochaetaceae bacterium]
MFFKKFAVAAFFAAALSVSAQAATISFMVIETGIREEVPTADSSRILEDALLDVFFDTGHIVSNTPIARVAEKPLKNLPDEARAPMDEALEGGAEFFVLAVLDYQNTPQTGSGQLHPRSISLRLFQTTPYRFLYSQEYNTADLRASEKDEINNAMNIARAIATHLRD